MKLKLPNIFILFACSFLCLINSSLKAQFLDSIPQIIYGEDNRTLLQTTQAYELPQSKSIAAMLLLNLETNSFRASTLQESRNLCPDERFSQNLILPECAGILISSNVLLTPNHCVHNQEYCDQVLFVFNFFEATLLDSFNEQLDFDVQKRASDVYYCKRILATDYDPDLNIDYSFIQLDREVKGQRIEYFFSDNDPKRLENSTFYSLGFGQGLPMTLIDRAEHLQTQENTFWASLDTFHRSSGAAVYNLETHFLEGILIQGRKDYVYDMEKSCFRYHQCEVDVDNPECSGELVFKISKVRHLIDFFQYLDKIKEWNLSK